MQQTKVLNLRTWRLEQIVLAAFIIYLTIHLLDEAAFGFAPWAEMRWGIPNYTVPRWLLHNVYFAAAQLIGYLVYRRDTHKYAYLGLGILVWGVINSLNHLVFSLIFLEYSPGLVTGFSFIFLALLGFQRAKQADLLSKKNVVLSLLFGLLYWLVPIVLFVSADLMIGY